METISDEYGDDSIGTELDQSLAVSLHDVLDSKTYKSTSNLSKLSLGTTAQLPTPMGLIAADSAPLRGTKA